MGRRLVGLTALLALGACGSTAVVDAGARDDAGPPDAGAPDAGGPDAGAEDAGPPPPGDTCGDALEASAGSVDPDGTIRVRATTRGARDDVDTCDEPGTVEVGDVIARYEASARGRLTVGIEPVGAPSRFEYDVRTACDDAASSLACDTCGRTCLHRLDDVGPGDTFFVVATQVLTAPEGSGELDFTFALDPFLADGAACDRSATTPRCAPEQRCEEALGGASPICVTPACGDGFVSGILLECDDGNTLDGDGCDAGCALETQGGGGDGCDAATELHLAATRLDTLDAFGAAAGSIAGGSDADASCGDGAGPEAIYVFTLGSRSRVVIAATGVDVISLHDDGTGCGVELGCVEVSPGADTLAFDDLAAGTYRLVLDRSVPTAAPDETYEVTVRATPIPS